MDRFDPFWTDLIHFWQIWSNLMKKREIVIFIVMPQNTIHSTELHISWKSDSFVIMNCWQLWQRKLLRLTIFATTFGSFFVSHYNNSCPTVLNFGILNHNSTRCTCKVFVFWGRVHISRPYCSRILNFSRIYFLEQKMKQNSAKVMKQNFWIVLFSRILNFGRKSNGFVFCWKIKFCKSCGM